MKRRGHSLVLGVLLLVASATNLAADLNGKAGEPELYASEQQVTEVYQYQQGKFLAQNEVAALNALHQLRQALEQHQQAIIRSRAALDRFARASHREERVAQMKSQLARLEQTVRYQYLLQMLWLDPENKPGREGNPSLPGPEDNPGDAD